MKFHQFDNSDTEHLFKQNNLADFAQLWDLESPWFEAPNYRRNGWSGVTKFVLKDANGVSHPVFIKRQENHNFKTLLHPIKGIPTFRREFINLKRLNDRNIPTLNCLYYGERMENDKAQSILITQSLEGYESFEEKFNNNSEDSSNEEAVSFEDTRLIMQAAGRNTRLLHDANYRHGSLYPKHFFAKLEANQADVRLIDLEKLKWYPFRYLVRFNDLSRIIRRRTPVDKEAIKILIAAYLKQGEDLSHSALAKKLYLLLENT
ncbi:lipopolysaccharide kinase InaA family protein [sulfur-oxidizing endosymbiont of Gigantopelta aegis]|uniref:lipopolysaccharide kinase InaA family protein n=1 Tax=sulfur-oxidizing endosymbiont of Gigantopelta aegis TaxID=2794934 RepID=UPI0018DE2A01|nr:lipopolysaccharide kinase InaA family protein [sulfur-oxidizing endosymbiont of Gigantopelta aegis]